MHRLLEHIGAEATATVAASAAALEVWLGPTRITPRFPTPLQKALSA